MTKKRIMDSRLYGQGLCIESPPKKLWSNEENKVDDYKQLLARLQFMGRNDSEELFSIDMNRITYQRALSNRNQKEREMLKP